jgi:hypothetical protein
MSVAVTSLLAQGWVCVLLATPITPPAPATAPTDLALTVSPSRMVIPADQLARERLFTVTNGAATTVEVVVRAASFAAGPDGAPVLRADAPRSAAGWVTLRPDRLRLAGGAAQQVTMGIAVPADTEPGEHQLAVVFSVPVAADQAGIGVAGAVGAPVYISVSGKALSGEALSGTTDRSVGFLGLPTRPVGWGAGIVAAGLLLWVFRRRIRRGRAPTPGPFSAVEGEQPAVPGMVTADGRPAATQGAP